MAIGDGILNRVNIAGGATLIIQAAAGEQWLARAAGGLGGVHIGITDGLAFPIFRLVGAGPVVESKPLRIGITDSIGMFLKNVSGFAADFTYSALFIGGPDTPPGRGDIVTGVAKGDGVSSSSYLEVRPPQGQEYTLFEFGANNWSGVEDEVYPDMSITYFDGSTVVSPGSTSSLILRQHSLLSMHDEWIRIAIPLNTNQYVGYSGVRSL